MGERFRYCLLWGQQIFLEPPAKQMKHCSRFRVDLLLQLSRYSANTIEDCLLVQRLLVWLPAATTSSGASRMAELLAKVLSQSHMSSWNC